jgi:predicted glycosyltransferase
MQERNRILLEAVDSIRPDTVLIEHFPFSKLHLRPEILPIINRAREINSQARVVCSLRDISPRTANEPDSSQYRLDVLHMLESYFDGILVHADPGFVRLEEGIPWARDITVPIEYTGYVSERPSGIVEHMNGSSDQVTGADGLVIASAGGSGNPGLLRHYINAWKHAEGQETMAKYRLVIFAPLFLPENKLRFLKELAIGSQIDIRPFTSNFLDWMYMADLTINEAGYNTCTNILETRTPAIIIPNPLMSDQTLRARRFASSHLATVIEPRDINPGRLGKAIIETLAWPASKHNIDLDGAQKTLEFLGKP